MNQILETAQEIAAVKDGHIVEFNQTEVALADLKIKYSDLSKFDVSTPEALRETKKSLRDLAEYRINLEKKRKVLKEPILERGRLLDAEAKRIAEQLAFLEDPLSAKVDTEEKRLEAIRIEEERKEALRVEELERRLAEIREWPLNMLGQPLKDLRDGRINLNAVNPKDFSEFEEACVLYKIAALGKLDAMIYEAEQKEEDARRAAEEKKEQDRINLIKESIVYLSNFPRNLNGLPVTALKENLIVFGKAKIDKSEFAEFYDEAIKAWNLSKSEIAEMIEAAELKAAQAKELEDARIQRERDAAELAQLRADKARAEQALIDAQNPVIPELVVEHIQITEVDQKNFDAIFASEPEVTEEVFFEVVNPVAVEAMRSEVTREDIISLVAIAFEMSEAESELAIIKAFN